MTSRAWRVWVDGAEHFWLITDLGDYESGFSAARLIERFETLLVPTNVGTQKIEVDGEATIPLGEECYYQVVPSSQLGVTVLCSRKACRLPTQRPWIHSDHLARPYCEDCATWINRECGPGTVKPPGSP